MWRAFERAGYKLTNKIRPKPVRKKKKAAGKCRAGAKRQR
jgi:hypothetical protein